jgi:LytS/YehU family sensor histidine kinase
VNFDEPVNSDPLFWGGIVVGIVAGVVNVVVRDLHGGDAVWSMVTSVAASTWGLAGVLGTTIRELYRRQRDRRGDIALLLKDGAELKEIE